MNAILALTLFGLISSCSDTHFADSPVALQSDKQTEDEGPVAVVERYGDATAEATAAESVEVIEILNSEIVLKQELTVLANEQSGTVKVPLSSSVKVRWEATDVVSCAFATGESLERTGERIIESIIADQIFEVICSTEAGELRGSVNVIIDDESRPTASLTINGQSGSVSVYRGGVMLQKWEGRNVTTCRLGEEFLPDLLGEQEMPVPDATTSLMLHCDGERGEAKSLISVNVLPLPELLFTANGVSDAVRVVANSEVELFWQATHATSCASDFLTDSKATTGRVKIIHTVLRELKLSCRNEDGLSITKAIKLETKRQPMVDVKVRLQGNSNYVDGPLSGFYKAAIDLRWTSTDVDECRIDGIAEALPTSGAYSFTLDNFQTLSIKMDCYDKTDQQTVSDIVTINVLQLPIITAIANGHVVESNYVIGYGEKLVLGWSASNADSCQVSQLTPALRDISADLQGAYDIAEVELFHDFELSCTNLSGTTLKKLRIEPRIMTRDQVKKACMSSATVASTLNASIKFDDTMNAAPLEGYCQWNANGNYGPLAGKLAAQIRETRSIQLLPKSLICNITVFKSPQEAEIRYDDSMYILLNEYVVAGTSEKVVANLAPDSDGLRRWNFRNTPNSPPEEAGDILGASMVDGDKAYCLGVESKCVYPAHKNGVAQGNIQLELAQSAAEALSAKLVATPQLDLTLVTLGDDDQKKTNSAYDCRHTEVKLDIELKYIPVPYLVD